MSASAYLGSQIIDNNPTSNSNSPLVPVLILAFIALLAILIFSSPVDHPDVPASPPVPTAFALHRSAENWVVYNPSATDTMSLTLSPSGPVELLLSAPIQYSSTTSAPPADGVKLLSIEENNALALELNERFQTPQPSGVQCSTCGVELLKDLSSCFATNPPQYGVECPKCHWSGSIY